MMEAIMDCDQLQKKIDMATFMKNILDDPEPFKKSLHAKDESIKQTVLDSIRKFLQTEIASLLGEKSLEEPQLMESPFTESEILLLKAFAKNLSQKPDVQKILQNKKESPDNKSEPKTTLKLNTNLGPLKVGECLKVIDSSGCTVLGDRLQLDYNDKIFVSGPHQEEGYYQAQIVKDIVDEKGNAKKERAIVVFHIDSFLNGELTR